MKTIKVLSLIIGIILCVVLAINILGNRSNIANGVTGDKIKKIKMEMPLKQVISILGRPYEIHNLHGQHNFSCKNPKSLEMRVTKNTDILHIVDSFFNAPPCCDAYKESIQSWGKGVTLTYTKRPSFLISLFTSYSMLWVHLDNNYCVNSVFVKRYEFIDDVCIYSLSQKLDETTLEGKPNEVDFFINNELFHKCFY